MLVNVDEMSESDMYHDAGEGTDNMRYEVTVYPWKTDISTVHW